MEFTPGEATEPLGRGRTLALIVVKKDLGLPEDDLHVRKPRMDITTISLHNMAGLERVSRGSCA